MIVRFSAPVLFSRITQHDSVASVKRAFQLEEVRELFRRTGVSSFQVERSFFFRLAGVLWK
jgi:hypothetical protein